MNEITTNRGHQTGTPITIDADILDVLTPSAIRSAAADYVKALDDRSRRVITRRFGLDGSSAKTLHAIGEEEGVTRERIRQIEQSVLQNFRSDKRNAPEFAKAKNVQDALARVFKLLGGIVREESLSDLLKLTDDAEKAALGFLMKCLPKVDEVRESNRLKRYFRHSERVNMDQVIEGARNVLKADGHLLSDKELFDKIRNFCKIDHPDSVVASVLSVTRDLVRTPFGDWGMRGWIEATPRGVGDKAFVILKREKEPRHFLKITELINAAKFDRRLAHPQTVHNELIRDERFVLVGRGLYALREWGYQPGTVGDVLERILKKNQQPMLKEDLVDAVLKERLVKRNTILLALQNRRRFARKSDGRYGLAEVQTQNKKPITTETVSEGSNPADLGIAGAAVAEDTSRDNS